MALSAAQRRIAGILVGEADRLGASPRVRKAVIEAGLTESRLRNLRYGDRDSLGVLQQRPSQGWAHALSPRLAARDFLTRAIAINKRGFTGSAGELAQQVQRSAFPGRYDQSGAQAESILRGAAGGGSVAGGAPSLTPGAAAGTGTETLLAALANQRPAIQATAPAPPAAAAAPALPAGFSAPSSSGAPQPKTDIAPLLAALRPQTADPVTSGQPAAGGEVTQAGSAPDKVRNIFERAVKINGAKLPYKWGGGHGGKVNPSKPVPLDCSGAVSAVLGINPRVSGQFESWGRPGHGKSVTIYANGHHVLMEINGHFFGTSGTNPGGGAGWIPRAAISSQYLKDFTVRHPAGL